MDDDYEFITLDGDKVSLAQLFDGRRQLVVYHCMFAPDWEKACAGCSFVTDHMPRHLGCLNSRQTTLVLVSRAPVDKLIGWKKRMDWTIPWYSSEGSMFNYDFHATQDETLKPVEYNYMSKAELENRGFLQATNGDVPGLSVFIRDPDDGSIYHTYSTWARGLDQLLTTNSLLDFTPLGRQDTGKGWKYHDEY